VQQFSGGTPFSLGVGSAGLCLGVGIGVLAAWINRKLRSRRLTAMVGSPSPVSLSEPAEARLLESHASVDSDRNSTAHLLAGFDRRSRSSIDSAFSPLRHGSPLTPNRSARGAFQFPAE